MSYVLCSYSKFSNLGPVRDRPLHCKCVQRAKRAKRTQRVLRSHGVTESRSHVLITNSELQVTIFSIWFADFIAPPLEADYQVCRHR
jgi:hypothetical protein